MKKSLLVGALIAVLVSGLFVLTGCEDKNKKAEENKTENTATTQTPADTSNNVVEATEFYVQNSFPNATTIKGLYATVSGLDTWTPNLINGLELAPGTRVKIGLGLTTATTTWDFKLVDEEGTEASFSSLDLTKILEKTADTVELTVDENSQITAIVK